MHASSIICAIKIKCYSSCVCGLGLDALICAEARCLWKIYISIGGEGYMVWTQTCQQIDKVTSVHSCSRTHMNEKNVPSPEMEKYAEHVSTGRPKIKVATLSSICYWKATLNHFVFMIFHHLPFYCRIFYLFFASIEGFSFCLLTGALSAREKNKLKPSSETYKRTSICCMVIYMGGI